MTTQRKASVAVTAILLAGIVAIFSYFALQTNNANEISSFQECAEAGNPILESYPRQCRTENGLSFTEEIEPTSAPVQTIEFQPIEYASPSAELMVKEEAFFVFQNEEEWSEKFPEAPPPMVDFQSTTLLALFSGEKPTGGYFITVEEITESDDGVTAVIRQIGPGENCVTTQALTYPRTFVAIPKIDKAIDFNSSTVVQNCE